VALTALRPVREAGSDLPGAPSWPCSRRCSPKIENGRAGRWARRRGGSARASREYRELEARRSLTELRDVGPDLQAVRLAAVIRTTAHGWLGISRAPLVLGPEVDKTPQAIDRDGVGVE
jgi:hypothetical protein